MGETCACDLESDFDEEVAARDLAAYRRHGLLADQRRLLAALLTDGVAGRTFLDIGGGIGAIHHELLRAGASSVTDVDGSTAYLDAARSEARAAGPHRSHQLPPRRHRPARRGDRARRHRHDAAGPLLLPGHAGPGAGRGESRSLLVRPDLSPEHVVDASGGDGLPRGSTTDRLRAEVLAMCTRSATLTPRCGAKV